MTGGGRPSAPHAPPDRLVGLLLVFAVVAVYGVAVLGGGFHFDDGHNLRNNPAIRTLSNVGRFYTDTSTWSAEPGNVMYRPTLLVTYAVDHALWGYRASGWVLTNVLLHAAASLLVWRLARRIGLSAAAAAFSGAVMALHPVHSEVVNYVSSRSESLAAVLMLGALHFHLTARERRGAAAAAWFAGSVALSMASLTAKETTALFFLAVVAFEMLRGDGRLRPRTTALVASAHLAGLAAVLLVRKGLLPHATAPVPLVGSPVGADLRMGGSLSVVDNLLKVQSRVITMYADLLLRPVGLNVDHDVVRSAHWSAAAVVALVLLAAVVAAAGRAALRGRRLFPLCVAWFLLFIAPSVALPLNVVMNEHRLYLPGIAVALLAGASLARVAALLAARWGGVRGTLVATAPLLLFAPLAVQRSREWRSDEVLWSVAVERAPGSARAHLHLGAALETRYRGLPAGARLDLLDAAIARYRAAERIHPRGYDVQLNLGNCFLLRGERTRDPADFERALGHFRAAGGIVGEHHYRPRYFQAVALTQLGRFDESLAIVRALRAGDDSKTKIYDDMEARTLRRAGDRRGAEAMMLRVIAIEEPTDDPAGLLTLGWWRFEDGDVQGARELLDRALGIANRKGLMLPFLYAARMLHLLGIPGGQDLMEKAARCGWSAPPDEVAWVLGGPTPGAATGTVGPRR